jgi:hypothetical protein
MNNPSSNTSNEKVKQDGGESKEGDSIPSGG